MLAATVLNLKQNTEIQALNILLEFSFLFYYFTCVIIRTILFLPLEIHVFALTV